MFWRKLSFAHALPRSGPRGCADLDSFRTGMRSVAGAVNVLTTVSKGRRYGLTATAVCSLSAEPPRLLACVNKNGVTFQALRRSRLIAVNVLNADQVETAKRFAGMVDDGKDRFDNDDWSDGEVGGLPILNDACAVFQCRVSQMIEAVSHAIFVCDVYEATAMPGQAPLVYCEGDFRSVEAVT